MASKTLAKTSKTFKTTIVRDGSRCFIPVTFDPKDVFESAKKPETRARRRTEAITRIIDSAARGRRS